jgi:GNAT superfamily N-acetyltransferase
VVNERRLSRTAQPSRLRVRLADALSDQDIADMVSLVQGLADYEKEPDAVCIGYHHYQVDANSSFFSLLLQQQLQDDQYQTCGIAVCYFGQRHQDIDDNTNDASAENSRVFLYLEDLFIEPQHRKGGGGVLLMECIAAIGLALDCSLIKWQALDWNTPALDFYQNKLGAKVQAGLHTSRYAGIQVLRRLAGN